MYEAELVGWSIYVMGVLATARYLRVRHDRLFAESELPSPPGPLRWIVPQITLDRLLALLLPVVALLAADEFWVDQLRPNGPALPHSTLVLVMLLLTLVHAQAHIHRRRELEEQRERLDRDRRHDAYLAWVRRRNAWWARRPTSARSYVVLLLRMWEQLVARRRRPSEEPPRETWEVVEPARIIDVTPNRESQDSSRSDST